MINSARRRQALGTILTGAAGLLAARAVLSTPAAAATFPSQIWNTGTAASVGLNLAKLTEAQKFAQSYGGGSGCIIRHGKLVHSWGSQSQTYVVHSSAKTWGSVLLGCAIDDGLELTALAHRYLPKVGAVPSSNINTGWLDEIRVDHLATHTAGLAKPGTPQKITSRPGAKWAYSDCGSNWLGAVVTQFYKRDLRQLCTERVLTHLDLNSQDFNFSELYSDYGVQATARFNGGARANCDAMARLGYLYLNDGNWAGTQIVSSTYARLSTRPYAAINVGFLDRYSLLWWNNGNGWMSGVPRDTYYSSGKLNNHTFVIPSLDLIAVRLGTKGWSDAGKSHADFLRPIVEAA